MRISFTCIESNRTWRNYSNSRLRLSAGRFEVCILAAQSAIVLNQTLPSHGVIFAPRLTAWASSNKGRTAGEQALKWDPTLVIAANNLEWSNRGLDSNRLLELDRRVAVVKTGETDFHRWGDLKNFPAGWIRGQNSESLDSRWNERSGFGVW